MFKLTSIVATLALFQISASATAAQSCADDSRLSLPPGFCATVFADGVEHARHLVVGRNGAVYVNTLSGRRGGIDDSQDRGFLVALQDTDGDGKADLRERFGETPRSGGTGGTGGTGIGLHDGALYAEVNDRIVRYSFDGGSLVPRGAGVTVVSGLPTGGDHPQHPFAIDAHGYLYVVVASATNSCQEKNRQLRSPGTKQCVELQTRGGIWRYDASKTQQRFSPAERYATGIRNAGGIATDSRGRNLYAVQHGRDQLAENWPDLYAPEQGATQPAEVMLRIRRGADYGWPECYYDQIRSSNVLSPEYGGDGGKAIGSCAAKEPPIAAFPAHWAPNALTIYGGSQFPQRYRHGAFIAFHGSWNRAPFPQAGFNVVFQSLAGSGKEATCEIFADGFSQVKERGKAAHRPTGLAVGPEGALYIADDAGGRIYRVTYRGGADQAKGTSCPGPSTSPGEIARTSSSTEPSTNNLPLAPGTKREMVVAGEVIYRGQSTCTGCHGEDATGTQVGPDLTDDRWLWSDGSLQGIARSIAQGVAQPKEYRGVMPAMGGAQLTDEQIQNLAAYLWSLNRRTVKATAATSVTIPGEQVFPESLTSSTDGTLIIGSLGMRAIFRARPGAAVAQLWIQPQLESGQSIYGVFADDRSSTLWACVSGAGASGAAAPAVLHAFDLSSGKEKARYPFPGGGGLCNDIAVSDDGTVYVTDSKNMNVLRLAPHAKALTFWAGHGVLGASGGKLDGIAVLGNRVLVNTYATGKLFAIAIERGGAAGEVTEVQLERAVDRPDGMRRLGENKLLLVESGGPGRLLRVELSGAVGKVTTLREGLAGGPVAVTLVGREAYVVEGQFAAMRAGVSPRPFVAIPVGVTEQ